MINYYYDIKPVYPYICLSNIEEDKIQDFVLFLKDKGITVIKFYEKPKYPASNGITYDFLFRINYIDIDKRVKPEINLINSLLNDFVLKTNEESKTNLQDEFLESERKYFKQIRSFLHSERRLFEFDRSFFKEQLIVLNNLISNLKNDNLKIEELLKDYNSRLSNEINSMISKESINSQEITLLDEKLKEKENIFKIREEELNNKEIEVENEKQKYLKAQDDFKKEIEKLKNELLGIDNTPYVEPIQLIKILIFGETKIYPEIIKEIFNEQFNKKFGEELNPNAVEPILLNYNDVKNSNVIEKIKSDNFDFIITGPHDHSIKHKDSKQSLTEFCAKRKLKAKVIEYNESSISKSNFEEIAKKIFDLWDEMNY